MIGFQSQRSDIFDGLLNTSGTVMPSFSQGTNPDKEEAESHNRSPDQTFLECRRRILMFQKLRTGD